MTRKIRNTAILAKIETTYGTDATPSGSADALLVSNPSCDYTYNNVDRSIVRTFMGASEQLAGNRYVTLAFDVEVSGSGTAGTAPAWGKLLRACGMAQTVTAGSRVEYTPVSTGFESLTIYYYDDGVVHKALGCMGNVEITMEEAGIPRYRFTFTGLDGGLAVQSNPAQTLTDWKTPVVINTANSGSVKLGSTYGTGALTGGTSFASRGLSLNLGNDSKFVSLLGGEDVDIYDRASTGTLQLDLDATSEVAAYAAVAANNLTSVGLVHGTTAGAKVLFFAPAVQRINPRHADYEGRITISFDLRLTPVSGNDELRIVAL